MTADTSLKAAITAIEAHLQAPPDIGARLLDILTGPGTYPNQRGARSYLVRRELTRNLDESRNQDQSRVEDLIIVEIQARINPKNQRAARNDAYDLADVIRNRITGLGFERRWNLTHLDTREVVRLPGEWFTVLVRFTLKRFETVGSG